MHYPLRDQFSLFQTLCMGELRYNHRMSQMIVLLPLCLRLFQIYP